MFILSSLFLFSCLGQVGASYSEDGCSSHSSLDWSPPPPSPRRHFFGPDTFRGQEIHPLEEDIDWDNVPEAYEIDSDLEDVDTYSTMGFRSDIDPADIPPRFAHFAPDVEEYDCAGPRQASKRRRRTTTTTVTDEDDSRARRMFSFAARLQNKEAATAFLAERKTERKLRNRELQARLDAAFLGPVTLPAPEGTTVVHDEDMGVKVTDFDYASFRDANVMFEFHGRLHQIYSDPALAEMSGDLPRLITAVRRPCGEKGAYPLRSRDAMYDLDKRTGAKIYDSRNQFWVSDRVWGAPYILDAGARRRYLHFTETANPDGCRSNPRRFGRESCYIGRSQDEDGNACDLRTHGYRSRPALCVLTEPGEDANTLTRNRKAAWLSGKGTKSQEMIPGTQYWGDVEVGRVFLTSRNDFPETMFEEKQKMDAGELERWRESNYKRIRLLGMGPPNHGVPDDQGSW